MKIRSITYFCDPGFPVREEIVRRAGEFLVRAKAAFEASGFEVQSLRLACPPFPQVLGESQLEALPQAASKLEHLLEPNAIGYASFGPALPAYPRSYEVIPEAVAATQNVFFGGIMADRRRGVDLRAIKLCAQVIVRCGSIEANGFANLRFAGLANVLPGSPFFPAAYHGGRQPAFAIATEAADLAVNAFDGTATVEAGRQALVASIEKHAASLKEVAGRLVRRTRGRSSSAKARMPAFLGIDFSLAPFPEETRSLGTAFERMGVPRVGLHGSLAAAAILTECIDRARFPRTGFCGLFMPVLEDGALARAGSEGTLRLKDVLLYSAVCGTGLDTIPLPGDVTDAQITPVLLDLAAMALRLDKPLTARLMPIPGKKAGDRTDFDFAYFANSKVMELGAEALDGALVDAGPFSLRPR